MIQTDRRHDENMDLDDMTEHFDDLKNKISVFKINDFVLLQYLFFFLYKVLN